MIVIILQYYSIIYSPFSEVVVNGWNPSLMLTCIPIPAVDFQQIVSYFDSKIFRRVQNFFTKNIELHIEKINNSFKKLKKRFL